MKTELFEKQLEEIISDYEGLLKESQYNDLSDLPKPDRQSLITRSIASIHRITGEHSTYSKEINRIIDTQKLLHEHSSSVIGVVKALLQDLKNEYLKSLEEIIYGDVFSDFLEMAEYLVENNYKDPAAVIAGSTLESHIKKIAQKNSVNIINKKNNPIKADRLNAELYKSNAYSKLDHKNITAWLDLRNKAAHGDYDKYSIEQVKLLITSVKDFITRVPA